MTYDDDDSRISNLKAIWPMALVQGFASVAPAIPILCLTQSLWRSDIGLLAVVWALAGWVVDWFTNDAIRWELAEIDEFPGWRRTLRLGMFTMLVVYLWPILLIAYFVDEHRNR